MIIFIIKNLNQLIKINININNINFLLQNILTYSYISKNYINIY